MRANHIALALALGAATAPAAARNIVVAMKNQGTAGFMVFEPSFVKAAVGDTIRFVPTDAGHNAETIDGMLPAGVAATRGAMSKEFVLKLGKAGVYGIKCAPHFSMGMVALIQAGNGPSPNLAATRAVSLPPLAAKRLATAFATAK